MNEGKYRERIGARGVAGICVAGDDRDYGCAREGCGCEDFVFLLDLCLCSCVGRGSCDRCPYCGMST